MKIEKDSSQETVNAFYLTPFSFVSYLRNKPQPLLDWVALLDLVMIGALFALLSSSFIFFPGLNITLPEGEGQTRVGYAATDVLTAYKLESETLYLYDGAIYTKMSDLNLAMKKKLALSKKEDGHLLLIKADKKIDMEDLVTICDLAKLSGFEKVEIAAK